ncbi:MAG: ABC transporter permease [Anaerolineaceae bacterium]
MRKVWLVFKYEYLRHVLRKRFILALFSLPLFFLVILLIGMVLIWVQYNPQPVGYVDFSGVLNHPVAMSAEGRISPSLEIRRFDTEENARAALLAKKIQAYFVLDANYLQTGDVRLVALETPGDDVQTQFREFLRANLVAHQPAEIATRLLEGAAVVVRASQGNREMAANQILNIILPLAGGFLFILATNTSGSYLLQALVEEKENRTMEIIVTSLSPGQLMAGKIAGNMCVGLTSLLAWIVFGLLALLFAIRYLFQGQVIQFDLGFSILTLATLLPAFILVAAMMAAVGATATESREAQQVAGLFTLPLSVPFMLLSPILSNPNSPLSIGLSLFPLTAPVTLPLRAALTLVPVWQIATNLAILFLLSACSIWFAGRAFRLGMLRYGKRLSWKELMKLSV